MHCHFHIPGTECPAMSFPLGRNHVLPTRCFFIYCLFRVCLTDAYKMVISSFPVFQISGHTGFLCLFGFFSPLPTLWNFFPSQVPLDLAFFITPYSFSPPRSWMEVLSNVSLPLVLECPAIPCASLLLLSILYLASVVHFFFFFLIPWHTFPSASSLLGGGNSWGNHAWCGRFALLTHSHSGKWDGN